jgi:hypothetical protein
MGRDQEDDMPAKKKAQPKPPIPKAAQTFEVALLGADFPCEHAREKARELYEIHGEKVVALVKEHRGAAIPISFLLKVIEPTLKGKPPVPKAHVSIKERTKE